MTTTAAADGLSALHRLKSTEPPLYLTPSPELSKSARLASQHLFSSLNPFTPKSPFSHLLTEGFDAEQIWQQIDLQSQPLLSSIRRHVSKFEKNPEEIEKQFNFVKDGGEKNVEENGNEDGEEDRLDEGSEGLESDSGSEGLDDEDEEEEEGGSDEDDGGDDEVDTDSGNEFEDEFLKMRELEKYMKADEAREYGLKKEKKRRRRGEDTDDDEDEEGGNESEGDEDEDEDEDDGDELGLMALDDNDDDDNEMGNARYEDFFGGKNAAPKKKSKQFRGSDDFDMDDEPRDDNNNQKKQTLSTHEKEQQKLHAEIKEIEKANLEPKTWTMQGEVTAAKRPKNSALEVDLDFEHNVRPAPVITEEVTASLEELIQKRVLEGRFDDVQKRPTLLNKAPREKMEMDENKSKKGLAELYEDEYAQKTGLVSTALTFSDEQKKEATMIFKKLCLKLDALSHFHFTPKPVIEDMSIQANVPALAMEEIAPWAVSDAAMLAPEEVFAGKGDIKEETELTQAERKRRRANKKRKYKAESAKRVAIKTQKNTSMDQTNGDKDS